MKNYFDSPIFVLGLPRSGTSMVAGALGICGAWTGTTIPGGGPVNPKGFFEHSVIREHVIKKLLAHLGCDPLGVRKIPPVDLQGDVPALSSHIYDIIRDDGYKSDQPWLYKDAKLTLLWPFFKKAFPNAQWVIVRRDEKGFIDSCIRTHFMSQHSVDRDFWKTFSAEYHLRINALIDSEANVLEISSPDIIGGDFSKLHEVVLQLGLSYQEKALKEFISPLYWHGDSD